MAYDTWGGSWGTSWALSWTRGEPTPPQPEDEGQTPAGRSKRRKKKRYALEHNGETYWFEDFKELERKNYELRLLDYDREQKRSVKEKRKPQPTKQPRIVIPVETVVESLEADVSGIQKAAKERDFEQLRRIDERLREHAAFMATFAEEERKKYRIQREKQRLDDEDEEDFKEFLAIWLSNMD